LTMALALWPVSWHIAICPMITSTH
jgi:hypothetical protein